MHNDTVPKLGGDTLWASGYSAYEKLSPEFRNIIDGKKAIYKSAHTYLDRNDPHSGLKHIERIHPIVRVHPATGWKALWVNRAFTKKIIGLDQAESDVILNYLFDVFEKVSFPAPTPFVVEEAYELTCDRRTLISRSDSDGRREPARCGITGSLSTMPAGIMRAASLGTGPESPLSPRSRTLTRTLRQGVRR